MVTLRRSTAGRRCGTAYRALLKVLRRTQSKWNHAEEVNFIAGLHLIDVSDAACSARGRLGTGSGVASAEIAHGGVAVCNHVTLSNLVSVISSCLGKV